MGGQRKIAPPAPEMGYYTEGEGTVMKIAEMGTKGEEEGKGRDMTWGRGWRGRTCVTADRRGRLAGKRQDLRSGKKFYH